MKLLAENKHNLQHLYAFCIENDDSLTIILCAQQTLHLAEKYRKILEILYLVRRKTQFTG